MMMYILIGAIALGILLIIYSLLIYKPKEPGKGSRDIMLIVGGVSYLAGGLALAFGLLRGLSFKTDKARL